ncbi:MAG: hypothetical protein IH857_00705 [Deltaproteobacteria bacterium]|nr:hypothetical protein [Deltaproteobacteria bacterium]
MPFVKGKRHPRQGGRQNPPGGRPTRAQVAERQAEVRGLERVKAIFEKEIDREAKKIVKRYLKYALNDPATLRHVVDRFLPAAKQAIEISSNVGITLREYTSHGDR